MSYEYEFTRADHALTAMDQILDAARLEDRDLTESERKEFDAAERAHKRLTGDADGDQDRFARFDALRRGAPNINRLSAPPPHAERSLDQLLWATAETTPCGSITNRGEWRPSLSGATAPVEAVALRSESGHMTHAPRLAELSPDHRGAVRSFQSAVAAMSLFGLLVDKSARTSAEGFQVARNHPAMRDRWNSVLRAMDVDTSAEGGTWVPTGIGATMHEKVRASGKVAPLFTRIDLPTNPWKWPIEGGDATAYRVAEPTTDNADKVTASTPGTVAATFDAEIMGGRTIISRSVDADSAVAVTPFVTGKLVRAFVAAEEKAILDGDTDGTHQDTDIQAAGATHFSTAWDGLRKKALAQTATNTGAATTVANLATLRESMGKWGVNPDDLAFIVGITAFHALIQDDAVETVEKFGPNATILNGQLGSLYGIPIIVSEHVREDLNTSGVDDGITATDSYNLCVNRNEFALGQREALDIEVDDSIHREAYQRVIIGFMREDFVHIGDAATNDDVAIGYGVA